MENRSFCENSKKKKYFWGGGRVEGGGEGGSVGFGGQGGCERRSKVFVRIQKKNFEGGVGVGSDQGLGWGRLGSKVRGRWVMWGGGSVGFGGQGGCERRSKVFVRIQKKNFEGGGGVGVGGGGGGRLGSKVRGRWVMWGMGDVNQE